MPDLADSSPIGRLQLVLLADSDQGLRQTYRDYLAGRGMRVEEASDGREALAKAISERPDAVVTDPVLPGLNGFDLCRLLKQDVATDRTPVIFLTTDTFDTVSEQAERAGGDLVLAKPCPPQLLVLELRRLCARSRELRAQATLLGRRFIEQLEKSKQLRAQRPLSKMLVRYETMTPPYPPPNLVCPACDGALTYRRSHLGGVSERHVEQWDYFSCANGCGTFQYRQRTRRLRRV